MKKTYKITKFDDEYIIQAKNQGAKYPYTIHKRFFSREAAKAYIKTMKKRDK